MSEPKPFASLSSGLLARKGAAKPAMRPQGFGQMGAGLEDLGWNDMGFEPPKPSLARGADQDTDDLGDVVPAHPHNLAGLTPVESPVHKQQAELNGRLSSYSPEDAGEDEDYDDTAELYDPEAEEAGMDEEPGMDEEFGEEEEAVAAVAVPDPVQAEVPEAEVQEAEDVEEVAEVESPIFAAPVALPVPVLAPAPRRGRKSRAAPGSKDKAAFTLRLDSERHLKLRLASAVNGRSAQLLVTEALDRLLATMPELEALAGKAKKKG